MINLNTPSNLANAVAPFSPVGRQPVGQENGEERETPFSPVIETEEPLRGENQRSPEERRGESDQRVSLDQQSSQDEQQNAGESARNQDAEREAQVRAREQQEQRQLEDEQRQIRQLAERDREVRTHEQAHVAAGGRLAGAASYTFERGPDGVNYAVAGEVPISFGAIEGDPQQTLQNAETVQRAALAPAEPSSQDRQVAAAAAQIEREARQEIASLEREEAALRQAEAESEREQRLKEDEREREASESREDEEQETAADRLRAQTEISGRNIDINQRLIDIGVNQPVADVGSLLNQVV